MYLDTVLLVEDNLEIRENFTDILRMEGYAVTVADNGQDGLRLSRELLPNIIICDMLMPQMNGAEMFQEVKSNPSTCDIPFLFITASAEKSEIELALALGADGYLCKPFEPDELLKEIARVFEIKKKV